METALGPILTVTPRDTSGADAQGLYRRLTRGFERCYATQLATDLAFDGNTEVAIDMQTDGPKAVTTPPLPKEVEHCLSGVLRRYEKGLTETLALNVEMTLGQVSYSRAIRVDDCGCGCCGEPETECVDRARFEALTRAQPSGLDAVRDCTNVGCKMGTRYLICK